MKTLLEKDPDIKKAHGLQSQGLCQHRARPNRPDFKYIINQQNRSIRFINR